MADDMYPRASREFQDRRRALAPKPLEAFHEFSRQVFAPGALDVRTKQLIAVAVAHTTQCPYCIRGHTAAALNAGASEAQIMEAIWVAAEMRAGAAYAHSTIALDALREHAPKPA
jgi:AhpD family alkylhydroperoxidase